MMGLFCRALLTAVLRRWNRGISIGCSWSLFAPRARARLRASKSIALRPMRRPAYHPYPRVRRRGVPL